MKGFLLFIRYILAAVLIFSLAFFLFKVANYYERKTEIDCIHKNYINKKLRLETEIMKYKYEKELNKAFTEATIEKKD